MRRKRRGMANRVVDLNDLVKQKRMGKQERRSW